RRARIDWAWGCMSAARSSRRMAVGCGAARSRPPGVSFEWNYRSAHHHRPPQPPIEVPAGRRSPGGSRSLPANHVVAGIDVMALAGHAARQLADEVEPRLAHLVRVDVAAERALGGIVFENLIETVDARRTQRPARAGRQC